MLMLVFEKRYIFIKFLGIFHLDTLLFVNSGSRPCTGQLQVTTRSTETQRLYWSHIDFMIATKPPPPPIQLFGDKGDTSL